MVAKPKPTIWSRNSKPYPLPKTTSSGAMSLYSLANLNRKRCESRWGFNHPLGAWSALEWAGAAAGELGEACNIAKKISRIRKALRPSRKKWDQGEALLIRRMAEEMADTIIYLDLLAASEGIDLSEAIRAKWNKVSKEIGWTERL